MERRALSRRCAGYKNVSMWMDGVLTWDGSPNAASENDRRSIKAFRPQPESSVFSKLNDTTVWKSESRESFKPHDVTKIDYVSEGAHVRISKKLLELKSRQTAVGKENDGDTANTPAPGDTPAEEKSQNIENKSALSNSEQNGPVTEPAAVEGARPAAVEGARLAEGAGHEAPEPSAAAPEQSSSLSEPKSKVLIPPPSLKKKAPTPERQAGVHARRQKTRQLIKAKWEARRYAQASKEITSSRQLSDTAVAFVLGRRPFVTFADQTGSRVKDSSCLSFNINPELYPNQPALVQTADSAVERAILKNGPQPIGCRQRIKMLQNTQVRKQLERRQESLARLSQSARSGSNENRSEKPHQKKQDTLQAEGFFVKI